jgi:hypothetical protein
MTTPLVLLGLAILAGAVVWVLSVRQSPQRGSSSWEPAVKPPGSDASPPEAPAMAAAAATSAASEVAASSEPVFAAEGDDVDTGAYPTPTDSFAYVPLGVSDGLDARTRLLGVVGLVALIVLTSAAVALGVWFLGHAVGRQLSHFATG